MINTKVYFDSEQQIKNQRQIEADIAHSKATGRWGNSDLVVLPDGTYYYKSTRPL